MDLVAVQPAFNLYNTDWPIFTSPPQLPPAKFVFEDDGRAGQAFDSIVSAGSILTSSTPSTDKAIATLRPNGEGAAERRIIMEYRRLTGSPLQCWKLHTAPRARRRP